jgi:hypothetical protein
MGSQENTAAAIARAFATYALVPHQGFCPGAVLMGTLGLARSVRAPHLGDRGRSTVSIVVGIVVFGVQLLLWWLLYKAPDRAKGL